MAAIGKLLAVLTLVVSLGLLTWSVGLYVSRPGWFDPPPDSGIDKGNKPVGFAQLKAETESLNRAAAVASEAGGVHAKLLDEREKYRAARKAAFAQRLVWAHKGHPTDKVDKDNPKSPGKGFYEAVVDPTTKLYDMSTKAGIPQGRAVLGTDGNPLPGLDGLLDTLVGDVTAMQELNKQIAEGRKEYDKLSGQVGAMELRVVKMGVIRDNVQAELFFLSTFEVNVFETRETVFRRERQLRDRLRILGIGNP
jgi:hypothetical protein